MAVGIGAISLQDVVDEEGAQTSLKGMADNYTGTLNATYGVAPVTSLQEFQGYSAGVTVYAVDAQMNKIGVSIIAVCSTTVNWTHYVNHVSGQPANGRILSNSVGTPLTGGNLWFRYQFSRMQVDNSGVISGFTGCF